ncbi:hypothetical protein AB0C76_20560 [Kitasatospora sp. NPDC048722]|uniref:hypothetical protein n=1 Tax=Kitasatospora sp. NPDC048722 TaxID=3155639 RepID=UPI0034033921
MTLEPTVDDGGPAAGDGPPTLADQRAWVRRGVYLAPVGQAGTQLALPAQSSPVPPLARR